MMAATLPYVRVVHADWGASPRKRWATTAARTATGWLAEAPRQVIDTKAFLDHLCKGPQSTLAGFDFPIGLPEYFGHATGLAGFCAALDAFGHGHWSEFYNVANLADEISIYRPFYPQRSSSIARQSHLIAALGCASIDQLRRKCERVTETRRAACPLFWTLGGNQVGKAAISGWQEVISPARQLGAKLWPFDGPLEILAQTSRLTLAETYPAEAYGHVGVKLGPGQSKRRQSDRVKAAAGVGAWSTDRGIALTSELASLIDQGFGQRAEGEDAFDAVMGLFSMIEIVGGRRPAGEAECDGWEGSILGQSR